MSRDATGGSLRSRAAPLDDQIIGFTLVTAPLDRSVVFASAQLAARECWSRVLRDEQWKAYAAQHYMRAAGQIEIASTGGNGWRPHVHVIVESGRKLSEPQRRELLEVLRNLWSAATLRVLNRAGDVQP